MSHNHEVFLGKYMKCKTQVMAYGLRILALIPSIVSFLVLRTASTTFSYFLLNFWGETDRVFPKNWPLSG